MYKFEPLDPRPWVANRLRGRIFHYTPPLGKVLLQALEAYSEGTTMFPYISVQTIGICFTPPGGP